MNWWISEFVVIVIFYQIYFGVPLFSKTTEVYFSKLNDGTKKDHANLKTLITQVKMKN